MRAEIEVGVGEPEQSGSGLAVLDDERAVAADRRGRRRQACRREHLAVTYDDETGAESLQGLDKRTAVEAARAALVAAKTADRAKQEAEAERKRAEDARRADLERMRREDDTARAALRAARGNEES